MHVLWITNLMLPPICEKLNMPVPAVGGWMYSSLKSLKVNNTKDVFAVATAWVGKEFKSTEVDGIRYYLLPLNGRKMTEYNKHLEKYWKYIREDFIPDVVHIHGSEYPHGLAYVNSCGSNGVVVSIQGIVACIARYYTGGIPHKDIKRCLTFRDLIRGGIYNGQKDFIKRGKLEVELLQNVHHIIGRTKWDKAHSWAINPNANYHHVGETLRDTFYSNNWDYTKCEPHTIFVSQASYPIKGLHKLLEALPLVFREFPDTKVYVAGSDESSKPWYRLTGYGKFLNRLIKRYALKDKIIFTGMLNEEQMCKRYLKSNLFICCSAIENSPNSLGEAQMLGMPYLATFVGGIPEIVNYNPDVLYRFEETEMLAQKICEVFSEGDKIEFPTFNKIMYDGDKNLLDLEATYQQVYNSYTY